MLGDELADDRRLTDSGPGGAQCGFPARIGCGVQGDRRRCARIQSAPAARRATPTGGDACEHAGACAAARCRSGVAHRVGSSARAMKKTLLALVLTLLYVALL